jgi:hypothetical protein
MCEMGTEVHDITHFISWQTGETDHRAPMDHARYCISNILKKESCFSKIVLTEIYHIHSVLQKQLNH